MATGSMFSAFPADPTPPGCWPASSAFSGWCGEEQLQLVRYAWRAYARLGQPGSKDFSAEIGHFQKVLDGKGIRIEFMGLWDTVASVFDSRSGFPWLTITQKAYTNQNDRVKIVRHAVAIDERRTYFQPSLWEPGQDYEEWSQKSRAYEKRPQDFEEVWFTGCHGDVGGGYPDKKSGLAKIPFEWLYREAVAAGVAGDEEVFEPPHPWQRRCTGHHRRGPRRGGKGHQALRRPRPAGRHQQFDELCLGFRRVPAAQGAQDLVLPTAAGSARSISRCSTTAVFRRAPSCTKR
jgi:hypothetical protein